MNEKNVIGVKVERKGCLIGVRRVDDGDDGRGEVFY